MRCQQHNYFLFFGGLAVVFLSACKNDIDLIDEYRETTVIYSLLNISDSVQYLRLEKAFLGAGNALLMAQHADSIYYDTTDIELALMKYKNDILVDTLKLYPTDKILKDDGLFVNYPHIMYKTAGSGILDVSSVYKLLFHNKKTNNRITATTPIVKKISLNPLLPSPLPDPSSSINLADDDPMKIGVVAPLNGKFLSLIIRINYTDSAFGTPSSQKKFLDYDQPVYVAGSAAGGQLFEYLINGEDFYRYVGSHIIKTPGFSPVASSFNLDFIFTVGAEELYTYYIVNNSTSSISDHIPDYTNLSSGKGIFSSRSVRVFPGKLLNVASMDSLINGQFTYRLFH